MMFNKAAGIALAMLVVVVSALFADSGQTLAEQFNQAIQSWQAGWTPEPPVSGGIPPRRGFRWRGENGDVMLTLRTLADATTAQSEFEATASKVSTGVSAVPGVGDRACVAGVPGGFTTMYVVVGRHMFLLTSRQPSNLLKPLAERFAAILRSSARD